MDNTDVYAFRSPDKPGMVTLIANFAPFSVPSEGPNFYPWGTSANARYDITVDTNGDAVPDHTFRYTFTTQDNRGQADYGSAAAPGTFIYNNGPVNSVHDATLLFKQFYTVTDISANGGRKVLVKHAPVAPDYVGPASMPNYGALRDQAIVDAKGGGKAFAGHAEDPFFLDIRVFDLLYGGNLSERGRDSLAGFNVNSIALQLPIKSLTRKNDPVLGVWSTASRPGARVMKADGTQGYQGKFVQVSRLGNPLVNEVVILALPFSASASGISPTGGVHAGGGGTANQVTGPASLSGSSLALPATGLAGGLVLLVAGALVLRRGRTRTDG